MKMWLLVPLTRQIIILFQRFSQDRHCISFPGPFLVGFKRKEQLLLDEGREKEAFRLHQDFVQ